MASAGKVYRSELEEPTSLTDFSASRLKAAGACGLAFKYHYVDKIPAPYDKSYFVFGNVFHQGVEKWYQLPDDGYRAQDLWPLVRAEWPGLVPPNIWLLIQRLVELNNECAAVEQAILFKRPELKNPRQTKDFITSQANAEFAAARQSLIDVCDRHPDIKWSKSEDPYAAYLLSKQIADWTQKRWQAMPPPLTIEWPFSIELFGYRVRGRIDAIRRDPLPTGEFWAGMVDYKTSGKPQTMMESFLQAYIYTAAAADDPLLSAMLGDQLGNVAFYLARKDQYQQGWIDLARHESLASRIFHGRARDINTQRFEPAYGPQCAMCDYRGMCEDEIALWQGDGLVSGLMARPAT